MIEDDLKKDVEKQINELDLQIEMVEKSKWIEQKNLLGQSSKLIYWFAKCHKRPPHYELLLELFKYDPIRKSEPKLKVIWPENVFFFWFIELTLPKPILHQN